MIARIASRREFGVAALLVTTVVIVQLVNPRFLAFGNVLDLLIQVAPFAILACGMTMVVLLGHIDISVGSMAGLLSAILGLSSSASHWGLPLGGCLLIVLGSGAALGAVNGALVAYARVPSIIVSLGMLTVLKGIGQALLGGNWVTDLPPSLRFIGTGSVIGLPVPILIGIVCVALTAVVLTQTPFGRRIYAIGSNPEAAVTRGLPCRAVVFWVFVLMGALVGVATIVSVPQLSVVESGFGTGWELFVITCVVVGGVSIRGGHGTLTGALLGVMLLGIVRTVLVYLKLGDQATYWERSIQGAFILAAALADRLGKRRAEVTV